MDDESGDDNRDELTSEWGGESRRDWRGWRNEPGSWLIKHGTKPFTSSFWHIKMMMMMMIMCHRQIVLDRPIDIFLYTTWRVTISVRANFETNSCRKWILSWGDWTYLQTLLTCYTHFYSSPLSFYDAGERHQLSLYSLQCRCTFYTVPNALCSLVRLGCPWYVDRYRVIPPTKEVNIFARVCLSVC